MAVFRLRPFCKETLWGGRRLFDLYGKYTQAGNIAEAWVLSAHPDGPSVVAGGEYDGLKFAEVLDRLGPGSLGTHCSGSRFPLLVKLIDAQKDLSLQVHPDDAYALAHGFDSGKTEAWYILDAAPGARLVYGVRPGVTAEKFAADLRSGCVMDDAESVTVRAGDVAYIPAGTLHAIGGGILLCEVQQSSDTTFRVYDYDRVGSDGKKRRLDIDDALRVIDFDRGSLPLTRGGKKEAVPGGTLLQLTGNEFFHMSLIEVDGTMALARDGASFSGLVVLSGSGELTCSGESLALSAGDGVFVPASTGRYFLSGKMTVLESGV